MRPNASPTPRAAFLKAQENAKAEERAVRAYRRRPMAEQRKLAGKLPSLSAILSRSPMASISRRSITSVTGLTSIYRPRTPKAVSTGEQAFSGIQAAAGRSRQRHHNEAGVLVDNDELGRGIDDLIQFNIEGRPDCRYDRDDLQRPTGTMSIKTCRLPSVRMSGRCLIGICNPPSGKSGWAVELHGYTYHHERRIFVLQGLVENIARVGITHTSGRCIELASPANSAEALQPVRRHPGLAHQRPAHQRPGQRETGPPAASGGPAATAAASAAAGAGRRSQDTRSQETKEPIKISHIPYCSRLTQNLFPAMRAAEGVAMGSGTLR